MRGRCYGSLDVDLSARGRALAELLAEVLAGSPLAAIYTSPRRRTKATAAPIAARHGLVPKVLDELAELDFGAFEGRTYEEIEASDPELFKRWMEGPTDVRFPGGEAFADLRIRALCAADALRRTHAGSTILLVTHGGVARALLAEVLGMPAQAIFRLGQRYGALNIIDYIGDVPLVRAVNGSADSLEL
jgi:broad specificity phosphatase PhoE